MFKFKKHNKQNVKDTKPEKLMTPQDYAVYVEPWLQYQPTLSKQQQDIILAEFTKRVNTYLKEYAKYVTRNTVSIYIPPSYISKDYVYYDRDNDKFYLLDFLANYLSNHGWKFECIQHNDANMKTGVTLKLKFDYEKYAKQANQESKPSKDSSPWYAMNHSYILDSALAKGTEECDNDNDATLLTPEELHNYAKNTKQSTRDAKLITDFTKWFNHYMKVRVHADKKDVHYYTTLANIPAEFIEYNKTYHDYQLLKQLKSYLGNRGWVVLYFHTGHSVNLPEVQFYALYKHMPKE